uniref:NADH dehydrogenase subunit 6 n=1 Tax=Curculionidae sp. BMNH 1040049 TaxID=1903777 RepID=A0A343A5X3_9CUCU|nr:NADH dehydrogenase subunit 6 [Curculionidae sp. BMNH 1040049]
MITLIFLSTISSLFVNHPLSMGFLLFLMTFLISITIGLMNMNYWFSYILFLILVSSLLVMFIYMTNVASNEKFKNLSNKYLPMFLFYLFILMILFMKSIYFYFPMMQKLFNSLNFSLLKESTFLMKFFNNPFYKLMLILMIFLLFTLIATIKISLNNNNKPMRMKYENFNTIPSN